MIRDWIGRANGWEPEQSAGSRIDLIGTEERNKVMGETRESWTIWVCVNCIHHAANGECGDCHREEGHQGGEPLSLLSMEACPGMALDDHGCDDAENPNYECSCETNTFSRISCEGCGSNYHGERHAMTEWSK